jgi:hypothetical protein
MPTKDIMLWARGVPSYASFASIWDESIKMVKLRILSVRFTRDLSKARQS